MKKSLVYVIIFIFCSHFTFSQDLKPEYQKFVKSFISNVKSDNKEGVASCISFPLRRDYPIPTVENKADFMERYDQIFDTIFKNEIIKSNPAKDWSEMGWRGIMLGSGDIWIDTDGKIIAINYRSKAEQDLKSKLIAAEKLTLHPSIAYFQVPVYILETSKFRIRIDDIGKENYRYASWSINKSMSDKPDLVITKGLWIFDGSGGNSHLNFKKDSYLYQCSIIVLGTSESPPANLTIYQNGKEILSQDAKIITK
ncbi:hypothetical protein C8C83_1921 [Flavobacterium sp. 90]|uniref:hypothetical protein n=1 Tax=unclassified Flavobacterium TaxID=196869 RepID=UPI000EAE9047|nr:MULTISPECIES: hypothetical protein [unclassified Flavobacterium]RKR10248.1 hypothetical protein C8C82_2224 [Flavobacterium sp. 81]TCK54033.1 hypothetical protein C8C83_1921 [Flavobacterium sp. 90]